MRWEGVVDGDSKAASGKIKMEESGIGRRCAGDVRGELSRGRVLGVLGVSLEQ